MPTLKINGRKVKVGDEFLQLSPDEQNSAVDEIAAKLGVAQSAPEPDNAPSMRAYEPTLSDRAFQWAEGMGLPAQQMRRDLGAVGAAFDDMGQAMTFNLSDEIEAGLKTGFGFLGDYDKELESVRGRMQYNREASPSGSLAGTLVGGAMLGGGMMRQGATMIPRFADASLKTRAAVGAGEGAAYGAAYGFGGGEDGFQDRALAATKGALVGGGIGGSIPAAGRVLRGVGDTVMESVRPRIGAILNPQKEAERRVGEALVRDRQMAQGRLSNAAERAGFEAGQDVRNFDRGSETVRALSRSVANQSPESRGVMERVVNDRFQGQTDRLKSVIERVAGGQVDDLAYKAQQEATKRSTNSAAYQKAWAQDFNGPPPMVFDELIGRVPAAAVRNARSVAKAEGRPFGQHLIASIDDNADTVTFTRMPSLREWHYIQRGLRSAADSAYRGGVGEVGTAYKSLHREILDAMDSASPAYQDARRGAAAFFEADDAFDAGKKFVWQNKDIRQSEAAFKRMSPAEREAFKVAFAGEFIEKLGQTSERRNVINQIFSTPNARAKINMVMGPQGMREVEAFVKVETAIDMMRGALTGNSTTARQLVELGLGAGAGGMLTGDWTAGALAGAVIAKGIRMGGNKADENALREVAKILLSKDRTQLARSIKRIANSRRHQKALDQMLTYLGGSVRASGAAEGATPQIASPQIR